MQDKYEREVRNAFRAAEAEKAKERGEVLKLALTLDGDESTEFTVVDALEPLSSTTSLR